MTTSKDPMVNSMETFTGALPTVLLLRRAITNNGPQINKINRMKNPPPWINLVRRSVRLPNFLGLFYKGHYITDIYYVNAVTLPSPILVGF